MDTRIVEIACVVLAVVALAAAFRDPGSLIGIAAVAAAGVLILLARGLQAERHRNSRK